MANTKIEWATKVWNPATGCSSISAGCDHCYAARMANRLRGRCGYSDDKPFRVTVHPDKLELPLKWQKPQRVFVNSMGDLFHDDVSFDYIEEVFAAMAVCPEHIFMVLTKRPDRAKEFYIDSRCIFVAGAAHEKGWRRLIPDVSWDEFWPLPNVWLGVTAENQQTADERIPILLQIPAVVRFVSVEPMLEPVNLNHIPVPDDIRHLHFSALHEQHDDCYYSSNALLDWVICGGETGPGARPMHPDWVRGLRNQCIASGTPYFFKQWGEWIPGDSACGGPNIWKNKIMHPKYGDNPAWNQRFDGKPIHNFEGGRGEFSIRVGKKFAGALLDGQEWRQFPEVRK